MEALLFAALLTGCTGSPIVGDSSNSVPGGFDSPSASLPLDVTQIPTCIPNDQLINGIRARSCNDFGFNLADSATNGKKLTMASSASEKNRLNSALTGPGTSAASTLHSPYLIADSSGNGGVNLPQLGVTALASAYALFMACAHSVISLVFASGTTHPDGTTNIDDAPATDVEALSTESDSSKTKIQPIDPCPFEIYTYRQVAVCDSGIQFIQYSELEDMFIIRNPTLFLGACTSLSFVPHWCCPIDTWVPDMNIYAFCWPFPINYDISAMPQRSLSTFPWWEFFNSPN